MLKNVKVIAAAIASLVFLAIWTFGSYYIGSDAFLAGLTCWLIGLSAPVVLLVRRHQTRQSH